MKINLTVINNGIIYIIQHNQEKEKEVKRAKKRKRIYSGKTIRYDIYNIKWLLLRDGYKVSERDLFQLLVDLNILYRDDSKKYQPTQKALNTGIITKKKAPNGKAEKYVPRLTDYGKAHVITIIKLSKSNNTK